MSTLALLVVLLLVVVVLLLAAVVVGYTVYRHPTWNQPVTAAISLMGLMITLVGTILALSLGTPLHGPSQPPPTTTGGGTPTGTTGPQAGTQSSTASTALQ